MSRLRYADPGSLIGGVGRSSAWFQGGVIAYANSVKTRGLGVSAALINKHGAVSAECAAAMAAGARRAAGAAIGVAITGVAGPDGGTKKKPVGLVFVAVSGPGKASAVKKQDIHGPRESVRSRAATSALALLKETLDGLA